MKCVENANLKQYNTYKINTMARFMYEPENVQELKDLLKNLNIKNIKYYILGGGSNVILPDENFDGAIIKLAIKDLEIKDDIVFVGTGYNLNSFIKKIIDEGYTNLTNLYGIPGTVGGAIRGNAGANGSEIFDDLVSVLVLQDDDVKLINAYNIEHSYRHTSFKENNDIIFGGVFKLEKGDTQKAWEIINKNLEKRRNSQPLEFPSAGSVFKNPEGLSAGKLIDECGLKGYKVGSAQISKKHANFIINLDNATSSDIISLIEIIKEKVKKEKGIDLELEQEIVKW